MKKATYLILYIAVAVLLGCTAGGKQRAKQRKAHPADTMYTQQHAMAVYDYQPELALQIVDSAEAVGNLSQPKAEFLRMRIYSQTLAAEVMDSLLGGSRFEAARAIGERLLLHDSVKADLGMQQDVLEALFYAARQQKDTESGLRWARQMVDVCHRQGAETEALRNEAEIGAILCYLGQEMQGMGKLDSVLALLDGHRKFNELDALIIASKRKMDVLANEGRYLETLPIARRIVNRLDDYELHPDTYHDGSYREPIDAANRADYIQFYRSQAQGRMTAVYAALGQQQSMEEVYLQIERTVHDATAREHIARYQTLEQQMLRQQAESRSRMMTVVAVASITGLLVLLFFAVYVLLQKRRIDIKNRMLVKLIESEEAHAKHSARTGSAPTQATPPPHPKSGGEGQAADGALPTAANAMPGAAEAPSRFKEIDSCIRSEQLYKRLDLSRQDICDHFGLRREQLNQMLNEHAGGLSFPSYINQMRLSEACRLLTEQPHVTVATVADEVGLTLRNLRKLFSEQYGMTPTEYRRSAKE